MIEVSSISFADDAVEIVFMETEDQTDHFGFVETIYFSAIENAFLRERVSEIKSLADECIEQVHRLKRGISDTVEE